MTQSRAAAKGLDIVLRWCVLAERRLDYLAELYETGRWQRYFTEADFLENFREARGAVDTWRALVGREGAPNNLPVDWSWLDRPDGVQPPSEAMKPRVGETLPITTSIADFTGVELKPDVAALAPLAPEQAAMEAPAAQLVAPVLLAETKSPSADAPAGEVATDAAAGDVDEGKPPAWSLPTLAMDRYPALRIAM